jgi:hypothetical protein
MTTGLSSSKLSHWPFFSFVFIHGIQMAVQTPSQIPHPATGPQ